MSMNLHAINGDKQEFHLCQTPTWLSYLALYDSRGKKRKPEETLHIYAEWAKGTFKGRDYIEDHLGNLRSQVGLKFEVY